VIELPQVPSQEDFDALVLKVTALEAQIAQIKPLPDNVKAALITVADYLKAEMTP
jgi:hypothetical protein